MSLLQPAPKATTFIENASRSPVYTDFLERLEGECPFCEPKLSEVALPGSIVGQLGGWVLKWNRHPYRGSIRHLVMFPKRHIVKPSEMVDADKIAFWDVLGLAADELGVATGGVAVRFSYDGRHGDSGATLEHLHGHIIEPDEGQVVMFQFGSSAPRPDES